jgi:hypothetical protein
MGLINRKKSDVDEKFVSLSEIAREVHADPRTVKVCMAEMGWHFPFLRKDKNLVISYILEKRAKKKSSKKAKNVPSEEKISETDGNVELLMKRNEDYGWHVSVRGKLGWIVIHIGSKEEMESWHKLFLRNEIESKVEENQKILMAYDVGLNS